MIADLAPGVLASVWLVALAAKLGDRASVRRSIEVVFGSRFARFAVLVPAVELGLAVALITSDATVTSLGLIASAVTLLAFTAFVFVHSVRAPTEACACFGPGSSISRDRHVAFNIAAVALSVVALVMQPISSDPTARIGGVLLGLAIAVPALVVRPIWVDLRRAER